MFCLVFSQPRLYVATIVFYTCVVIPFSQFKRALISLMQFGTTTTSTATTTCIRHFHNEEDIPIPVVKYQELVECTSNTGRVLDQQCSVCLVEFQTEEEVSQLSGCLHVFHKSCIASWLLRDRFTCPLCRSVFLGKCCPPNTRT
ncbi:hypothetical protein AQUCO_09500052v1 [Aquilegia coerulea]|uniref:RING-type domain-containing protein n=1 Tax=Aquilegia coerulea TaxID=218851 RepID=A0A2G5C4X0_AQUCA|nr:hypothetical protein AQUCO_09500052v1 [Aquilegia coerulea]